MSGPDIHKWLLAQPGWRDGSGEYRLQAWFPLPDGRIIRFLEEGDHPELDELDKEHVSLYDPRGSCFEVRIVQP